MATAALVRYTPEEYLALERHAEFKSEYLNGRIIAMTGASPEHADVVLNIGSALRERLRPKGCRVFVNDVRANIASKSGYVYPNVMAVCGSRQAHRGAADTTVRGPSVSLNAHPPYVTL